MVNLLEGLYVVTALALLVAALAWVQSKGGEQRRVRYGRRMRGALAVAVIAGLSSIVLYVALS